MQLLEREGDKCMQEYKLTISINFKLPENMNMIQITGLLQLLTPKHYFTLRQYHKNCVGKIQV